MTRLQGARIRCPRAIPLTGAALLCAFAAPAMAQATQQLDIDFTSVTLPLSPLLTVLVAVAVGTLGLYALRKARGRARLVSWLVITLAVLPIAMQAAQVRPIGVAQAIAAGSIALTTSPAVVTPTEPIYIATNVTGTNITITAVKVIGAGPYSIYLPNTTCVAGLSLPPGTSCEVALAAPV